MPETPLRLLIVKLGDTLPDLLPSLGDFEHWMADGLRQSSLSMHIAVCDPRAGEPLPELTRRPAAQWTCDGVVITGSHAMVSHREDWSEHTASWLRDAVHVGLPVLGICYGHQLLAHALGGVVDDHPDGLECGTTTIWRKAAAEGDALLGDMPSHWEAQVSHRQTVLELPTGAVPLAHNRFEPHHAFRFGRCAWGVQFHPEFSPEAMRAYVQHLSEPLADMGLDPASVLKKVKPTPDAASLLPRFAQLVAHHRAERSRAAVAEPLA